MIQNTKISYVLALASGNSTNDVRRMYVTSINEHANITFIGTIISVAVKMILSNEISRNDAIMMINEEYSSMFNDISDYETLIEGIINETGNMSTYIDRCKHLTSLAQPFKNTEIADGFYRSVVSKISDVSVILDNMEYAASVNDYIEKMESAMNDTVDTWKGIADLLIDVAPRK